MKVKLLSLLVFFITALAMAVSMEQQVVTIYLIGDSTVADKPFKDGNPEKGWGQVFPLYFHDGVRVDNHAVNGRSTKSFMDEGRWDKVLSLMKKGDYVIIEFGHNDEKKQDSTRYADPDNAYRANLIKYIGDTRAKGGNPILATPIVRRRFDKNGKFFETHGRYPEVVREVALSEKVPLLDMQKLTRQLMIEYGEENSKKLYLHIQPGEYPSLQDGLSDDTHLSPTGAFKVADLVIGELKSNVPALNKFLKD